MAGILEDLAPTQKSLEEFSAKAGDPLHFDQIMQGVCKGDPGQLTHYSRVTATACAAVYAQRQLEAWEQDKTAPLWQEGRQWVGARY